MWVKRAAACGVVAIMALCAAACGSQTAAPSGTTGVGVASSPTGIPAPSASATDGLMMMQGQCPTSATDPAVVKLRGESAQVALPSGFVPVAAVRCVTQEREVPGDGQWEFALAQRATSAGELDALATALRTPSQAVPTGGGMACAAIAYVIPDFAVVDAHGTVIRPSLPHDDCDQPLAAPLRALKAVTWTTETEQKFRQVQTQPEVDSGCYSEYKDVFELPGLATTQRWSQVPEAAVPRPTTVCVYKLFQDGSIPTGQFTRGVKLNASQQAALTVALQSEGAATPATPCKSTATSFAVFDDAGDGVAVELGGCHRTLFPNGFTTATSESAGAILAEAGVS